MHVSIVFALCDLFPWVVWVPVPRNKLMPFDARHHIDVDFYLDETDATKRQAKDDDQAKR